MSFSDSCSPDPSRPRQLRRRDLGGLAAAVAAAPVIGLAPDLPGAAARAAAPERLRLRRDPGSVVAALDVPLSSAAGTARSAPGAAVRTAVLETDRFSMLGVTWGSGRGRIRVRTRGVAGGWSGWRVLPPLHDGPDGATAEAGTPPATEPVWVGPCSAVQVEVDGAVRRPVLALIDPGSLPQDASDGGRVAARDGGTDPGDATDTTDATDGTDGADTVAAEKKGVPQPKVRLRKAWGANPKLLSDGPGRIRTVKQVHVHHTVNSNGYKRRDVPALIRGMYRYHTKSLGWSDIGYNFLVDRFGRIWVGRKGSLKMAQGAHTLGFNSTSVGVSVIGNFETARPRKEVLAAIARIAAWKLDAFDRDPTAKIRVRSSGSDKYRAGRRVKLPVIDGHRDTNDTACPGRHLYKKLPAIRRRTARRIKRFN
ncbi:N-acetylmuramoyl-L-alanine amidase [Nocardioides sp. YIM 152588]|uniref:N-acetylmuramoyl-L-alanine amidase n=1 Tax=Nocardioides sp. YIM 152588 TaxID=3158259 RepID=UPI0032E43A3E